MIATLPTVTRRGDVVVVVGGGPAGLMAAEVLATSGATVTVVEHMASVGRKLLLAGRGGLNLTHTEPLDDLLSRYGSGRPAIVEAIRRFTPTDVRRWCGSLGQPTFVGSTGRVFPEAFRATPLLRAWLARLESLDVSFMLRHRFLGWDHGGRADGGRDHGGRADGGRDPVRVVLGSPDGNSIRIEARAVVLALGGASWPRVGSDGAWTAALRDEGVNVTPLVAANVGYRVAWSPTFAERFAGIPLKNVMVTAGHQTSRGEAMITQHGIEGGAVYAVGAALRSVADRAGRCRLVVDLHPDLSSSQVRERLAARRSKDSWTTGLRRSLGLSPVAIGLLREATGNRVPHDDVSLAAMVKGLPLELDGPMPIGRAISTAGGISIDEIDDSFMLRRLPGVFVAGEMLDWTAPTGGYLLQASFSTGVAAAAGALDWLNARDSVGRAPDT